MMRGLIIGLCLTGLGWFAQASDTVSTRPIPRPDDLAAKVAAMKDYRQPLWSGGDNQICGDERLTGKRADPVLDRFRGCGMLNPVRVTKVAGVFLSTPILTDCPTAQALASWVDESLVPAIGNRGGGVAVIQVSGSYMCRPVNNQPGRRLSEHGRGRAIDISGFRMFDGQWLTVLKGWNAKDSGKLLRGLHAAACGVFTTVLGPEANALHRDHFHFDTATRIDGAVCQ
jgi:hypothetical protein